MLDDHKLSLLREAEATACRLLARVLITTIVARTSCDRFWGKVQPPPAGVFAFLPAVEEIMGLHDVSDPVPHFQPCAWPEAIALGGVQ
eukprot:6698966-Alexandrium_andersonii.AAC.1